MLAAAPVTIIPTMSVLPRHEEGRVHQPPEGLQTLFMVVHRMSALCHLSLLGEIHGSLTLWDLVMKRGQHLGIRLDRGDRHGY